jgi:hypothetical protein
MRAYFIKMPVRHVTAFLLMVVYTLITMSPLAPLAIRSPGFAHAVAGQCSGNCEICGCSAERRANHTCCCWMKKLKSQKNSGNVSCCKKKMRHRMTMISCNCPCGGNVQPFLPGAENSEHLPCRFNEVIVMDYDKLCLASAYPMTDRDFDPPDPPPKLLLLS